MTVAAGAGPLMNHADHVRLIEPGARGAGRRWLELGAGEGAFTLALAEVLGPDGDITALDRDASALRRLADTVADRQPGQRLSTVVADFRDGLPPGPWDGVLAANSLHFVSEPADVLSRIRSELAPGGPLVVVEYDADQGNRWVPHPFSSARFVQMAAAAGFVDAHEIGRVPSRFLGAIYSAVAHASGRSSLARAGTVLHSRPHGEDREE